MSDSQYLDVFYDETATTGNSVFVVVENNKVYKSHYSQRKFKDAQLMYDLMHYLLVNENYTMDKQDKGRIELVDRKTGLIRYVFWPNMSVEKYYREYMGDASADYSLENFS
jgi:hypothetical protein